MKLHATLASRGPLTKRECDVLLLLCQGHLRKQIAASLHRSYGCVSKQIEAIAQKLDAHSAAEIVARAVANGLINITLKSLLLIAVLEGFTPAVSESARKPPRAPRPPASRQFNSRTQAPKFQREI